jgi:hypothetical protein
LNDRSIISFEGFSGVHDCAIGIHSVQQTAMDIVSAVADRKKDLRVNIYQQKICIRFAYIYWKEKKQTKNRSQNMIIDGIHNVESSLFGE